MHTNSQEKIRTEEDYREALQRFLEIIEAPEGTPEAEELVELIRSLEIYEQENCN